ncbi:MAG: ABC transporter permease [Armatimonadetes bacterium]|nr:ABC transporter permease [Armatimonadota bacterium]
MSAYLLRRILQIAPTLVLITLLVFGLLQVTGGDPIAIMLGPSATNELIEQVRHELELDQPAYVRYPRWLWRVMHGDLGKSIRTRRPVAHMILARVQTTVTLAVSATLFSVLVGVTTGVYAAARRGAPASYAVGVAAIVGASVPNYFLALVLMVILGVQLRLVPIAAFSIDVLREPQALVNLIMPTIALGAGYTALLSRITRASVLEVLGQDYVRSARAKGLAELVVIGRHVLRNALLPVVTQVAINAVYLLGGSVLIETIFALSGIGSLLVESIIARDLPIVQGITLVVGLLFILANLLTDLLYSLLDPRIRYA